MIKGALVFILVGWAGSKEPPVSEKMLGQLWMEAVPFPAIMGTLTPWALTLTFALRYIENISFSVYFYNLCLFTEKVCLLLGGWGRDKQDLKWLTSNNTQLMKKLKSTGKYASDCEEEYIFFINEMDFALAVLTECYDCRQTFLFRCSSSDWLKGFFLTYKCSLEMLAMVIFFSLLCKHCSFVPGPEIYFQRLFNRCSKTTGSRHAVSFQATEIMVHLLQMMTLRW